jgi:hypothetical protein
VRIALECPVAWELFVRIQLECPVARFSGVTTGKSCADSQSVQLLEGTCADSQSVQLLGSSLVSCADMSKPNRVLLGLEYWRLAVPNLSQP